MLGAGFAEVPFGEPADCQILNTCTITREADRKSAQMLRKAQRLGPQVVVTGCAVAERGGLSGKLPGSVLRLPPENRDRLLELLDAQHCPSGAQLETLLPRKPRHRALLRIQDGCDQFCTFCIVPYVRGRSRSQPTEKILEQAREFVAQGYKEIVLTGIHLSAWSEGERDLSHLLESLLPATEGVRLRLSSVEPDLFPRRVFALMRTFPKRICPHLHLVLQHASDDVLRRMHRGYDLAHYEGLVQEFTQTVEGACLTTDLMVGFPGETEVEFQQLLNYVRRTPFYRVHMFRYSSRPGRRLPAFPARSLPRCGSSDGIACKSWLDSSGKSFSAPRGGRFARFFSKDAAIRPVGSRERRTIFFPCESGGQAGWWERW